MKNYIKQNKRFFVVLAIVAVAIVGVLVVFNIINSKSNNPNTAIGGSFNLPANPDAKDTIMKDFIDGTLGLNDDLVDMIEGGQYVFCTQDNANSYFASAIHAKGSSQTSIDAYLPKFSKEPTVGKFAGDSAKKEFYQGLADAVNLGNDAGVKAKKVQEGDYTFWAVPMNSFDKDNKVFGIDWTWLYQDLKDGKMQVLIDKGKGIPTDIIRKKCDLAILKDQFGYDFSNSFWDKLNYKEHLKCFKKNDTTQYIVLSPTWDSKSDGTEAFGMFAVNGTVYNDDVATLNKVLQEQGFETVDEAIAHEMYNPTLEGNTQLFE